MWLNLRIVKCAFAYETSKLSKINCNKQIRRNSYSNLLLRRLNHPILRSRFAKYDMIVRLWFLNTNGIDEGRMTVLTFKMRQNNRNCLLLVYSLILDSIILTSTKIFNRKKFQIFEKKLDSLPLINQVLLPFFGSQKFLYRCHNVKAYSLQMTHSVPP